MVTRRDLVAGGQVVACHNLRLVNFLLDNCVCRLVAVAVAVTTATQTTHSKPDAAKEDYASGIAKELIQESRGILEPCGEVWYE